MTRKRNAEGKTKRKPKRWQFEHVAPEGATREEAERRATDVIARLAEGVTV